MGDRSCPTRKSRFATREDVDRWLAQHRQTKGEKAPRMKAYECLQCGGWHLTKWQKFKRKKRTGVW